MDDKELVERGKNFFLFKTPATDAEMSGLPPWAGWVIVIGLVLIAVLAISRF